LSFLVIVVALLMALTGSPDTSRSPEEKLGSGGSLPQLQFTKDGELTFISAKGTFLVKIDIEIADTPEKRTLGMMYRSAMEDRQGMLFLFPKEEYQSFWMKNTAVSLDMIFVSARNEIVTIHENTTPHSPQSYSSTKPAQFVVEVNAGFVEEHGISVGDRIRWQRR
jgi:uncharacterized membrane protein (UPF0127 family)